MLPILYSFRRCPFAMRARMALHLANIDHVVREVDLKQKPASLLDYSPKGTVPVLVITPDHILEESLDIVTWAFESTLSLHWLANAHAEDANMWLVRFNDDFLPWVYRTKYPERHTDRDASYSRMAGRQWLQVWADRLALHQGTFCGAMCWLDLAVFPFVRQWDHFDPLSDWAPEVLQTWLSWFLTHTMFPAVMAKYTVHHD